MSQARFLVSLGIAALVLVAAAATGAHALYTWPEPKAVSVILVSFVPFALAAAFTLRFERDQDQATLWRATGLVLGSALLMRVLLLPCPPDSTDVYRYVWDGRVAAAGINPYRYIPADPALAPLRDRAVFPNINRAGYAPTIYPPGAQLLFRLVAATGGGVTAMKMAMVGLEAIGVAALLALLRRHGQPPTRVLLYAWHPLPLYAFAGSGHIDAAAIAFMLLALLVADHGRQAGAGALVGLGIVTKFFPVVAAPALYRRWGWRAPAGAMATVLLLYLPYLSVGRRVLGFLGGYAHEEAIDDGTGFFLLGWIDSWTDLPGWARPAYLLAGLAVLGGMALLATLRTDRDRAAPGWVLVLLVAFTFFMSPHLPWYFTWTVPFLCFVPSPAVLWLTGSAAVLYWQAHAPDDLGYSVALYLPFLVILSGELALRLFLRPTEPMTHARLA